MFARENGALGGVSIKRFVALTVPAALACLGVGLAIMLGWTSVAFASRAPLDISTSYGTAGRMSLDLAADHDATGLDVGDTDRRASAVVNVGEADLDDLCLVPRFTVPVLDKLVSLKISTNRAVKMNAVTLAAGPTSLDGIGGASASIGVAAGDDAPGRTPGGFGIRMGDGGDLVELRGPAMQAYGLTLHDGISMRSLGLSAQLGDQHC